MPIKVSVIVATKNSSATLEECLNSIVSQDHIHLELIVIDGKSSDETVNIIQKYDPTAWISEKDEGVYDAWNKGLKLASGDWIIFLGSDDYFEKNSVISQMVQSYGKSTFDIITVRNRLKKGQKFIDWGEPWQWRKFKKFMHICHVGVVHHRRLFVNYGQFDISFKIAGDYELLLRAGKNLVTLDYPEIAVCCGGAGLSQTNLRRVYYESAKAQIKHRSQNPIMTICRYFYSYAKRRIISQNENS